MATMEGENLHLRDQLNLSQHTAEELKYKVQHLEVSLIPVPCTLKHKECRVIGNMNLAKGS
jgi:hypothetical protein